MMLKSLSLVSVIGVLSGCGNAAEEGRAEAKREAAALGVDEAIFRSSDGYLLEGPTAGLLFSSEDQLWTIPFLSLIHI